MAHDFTLIGIDCSTRPDNVGMALAEVLGDQTSIVAVCSGSIYSPPKQLLSTWVRTSSAPCLIALDAPLGWPEALGRELVAHQAGAALRTPAHSMFRRLTDDEIAIRLGKRSLDVGANLIARTAHWAVNLLADLAADLGEPVPLAWDPHGLSRVSAIEVYPAATLLALAWGRQVFVEPKNDFKLRAAVIAETYGMQGMERLRFETSHEADGLVCVAAGLDFLSGEAIGPTEAQMPQAVKEGWIWVRDAGLAGTDGQYCQLPEHQERG